MMVADFKQGEMMADLSEDLCEETGELVVQGTPCSKERPVNRPDIWKRFLSCSTTDAEGTQCFPPKKKT